MRRMRGRGWLIWWSHSIGNSLILGPVTGTNGLTIGGGSETVVPTYFTYAAPAGTPHAVLARLNAELARAQQAPEVLERLAKAGLEPQTVTPEAFAEEVKRDLTRFRALVNQLDIPLQ